MPPTPPGSFLLLSGALAGLLLSAGATSACNVPVFRYALEKWTSDNYQLMVIQRGPLQPAEQTLLDRLLRAADSDKVRINLKVERLDLAEQPREEGEELLKKLPALELPALVLLYPHGYLDTLAWVGRLNQESLKVLLDSPVRRELVRRLVQGDSAVWLLLECGDRKKDESAAALLQRELGKLQKEMKLPGLTNAPEDAISAGGPPLRLRFSWLRLSRTDPAESALVRILRQCQPDAGESQEPMIFPVFGRGRILPALVGADITADNIGQLARFLLAPCTCRFKEQIPGVELLLAANWDSLLSGEQPALEKEPTPLTGLPALTLSPSREAGSRPIEVATPTPPESAQAPDIPDSGPTDAVEEGTPHLLRNALVGLAAGLVLVGLVSVVLLAQGRRRGLR